MKLTSEIKGCFYSEARRMWISRDPHKRVLYRGQDKIACEKARLAYDAGKLRVVAVKTSKPRDKFMNVMQPTWPSTTGFPV